MANERACPPRGGGSSFARPFHMNTEFLKKISLRGSDLAIWIISLSYMPYMTPGMNFAI